MTFAPGDKALGGLVRDALQSGHKLRVTNRAEGADFIGKLEIARNESGTTLRISVFARGGSLVIQAQRVAAPDGSVVVAAEALAKEVIAACNGERPPEPEPGAAPLVQKALPPLPSNQQPLERVPSREEDWSGQRDAFVEKKPRHLDLIAGAELAFGPILADPQGIIAGSPGFDLDHYAQDFTRSLDRHWRPAVGLHGGCRFLDYLSAELAYDGFGWSGPGGAMVGDLRLAGYPLQAIYPERKLDLGIELGFGYSWFATQPYSMSGLNIDLALTGEYRLNDRFSLIAFYRLYLNFLHSFTVDRSTGLSESVSGFTAAWHHLGVGIDYHFGISW